MDDNRIIGGAEEIGGRIESAVGALAGDGATELSGKAREFKGATQRKYGDAADAVRQATSNAPLTSLITAGGIGLMIGLFLNRR